MEWKYQDLSKLDWDSVEELRGAIEYHEQQLKLPYLDDQERNWTLRTIGALSFKLDKLTGNEPEWTKLFK